MTTTPTLRGSDYATGYVKGRHAAKERMPITDNPHRRGSAAFDGWNDGHYDEQSARFLAVERHSAEIWSHSDSN